MNPQQERERGLIRMMQQNQVRAIRDFGMAGGGTGAARNIVEQVVGFYGDPPPFTQVNNHNNIRMAEVEEVMKQRHLNKNERARYHLPKPDWKETPKGEVCKNSSSLEVEDIISKHGT